MTTEDDDFDLKDIHPLDIVTPAIEPLNMLPQHRLPSTILLSAASWSDGRHALLYHCQGRRTYMKGKCDELGLANDTVEHACLELSGMKIRQAVSTIGSKNPAMYILTSDGVLMSRGINSNCELGRPADDVPSSRFGHVRLDGVKSIAAGGGHVLAMTSENVYGFGWNETFSQVGVEGEKMINEPHEMYAGKDNNAPRQVACGQSHSAVLTMSGQVLTCGRGSFGATCQGHEDHVSSLTPVAGLEGKHVIQIGCTGDATYALADGILYVSGKNGDGSAGLGHRDKILVPTAMYFGNRRVEAFRCHKKMVVATCTGGGRFCWGVCKNKVVKKPCEVKESGNIRDLFENTPLPSTGGAVYIDPTVRMHLSLRYPREKPKTMEEQNQTLKMKLMLAEKSHKDYLDHLDTDKRTLEIKLQATESEKQTLQTKLIMEKRSHKDDLLRLETEKQQLKAKLQETKMLHQEKHQRIDSSESKAQEAAIRIATQQKELQRLEQVVKSTKWNLWMCLAALYAMIAIIFFDLLLLRR